MVIGEEVKIYQCKENDNRVHVCICDGELDEIWVCDELGDGHIIIGAADLKAALEMVGLTILRSDDPLLLINDALAAVGLEIVIK
jgi:hypothetical protein